MHSGPWAEEDLIAALSKDEQHPTFAAAKLPQRQSDTGDESMNMNTLLIIVVVVLLLGGGGFYFGR